MTQRLPIFGDADRGSWRRGAGAGAAGGGGRRRRGCRCRSSRAASRSSSSRWRRAAPWTTRPATTRALDAFFRSDGVEAAGVFLFSHERGGDKRHRLQPDVRARMPASPRIRPPAAPAARWAATSCATRSCRPARAGAILNLQGVKMGRPSHVHMSIGVEQRRYRKRARGRRGGARRRGHAVPILRRRS